MARIDAVSMVLILWVAAEVQADDDPQTGCVKRVDAHPEVYVMHPQGGRTLLQYVSPVQDMMDGWMGPEGRTKLTNLPGRFLSEGVKAFFPDQTVPLPIGTELKVSCPDTCDGATCEFLVAGTVEGTPPTKDEWKPTGCELAFKKPGDNTKYPIVLFQTLVYAGMSRSIVAPIGLRNIAAFGKIGGVVECERFDRDAAQCWGNNACKWDGGACMPDWCPTGNRPVIRSDPVSNNDEDPQTGCVKLADAHPEVYVLHPENGRMQLQHVVPLEDMMDAWSLGSGKAKLTNLPERFLTKEVEGFFPDQTVPLPAGTELKVLCPDTCGGYVCEFFIAVYHCPPCSLATNGGLPSILPMDGWISVGCPPDMKVPNDGEKHPMAMYKKLVYPGQWYSTPPLSELRHVAVFGKLGVPDCDAHQNERLDCVAEKGCWWSGKCQSLWCAKRTGPHRGGNIGLGLCNRCPLAA